MTPEEIPAELKALLDDAELNGNDLEETLAQILTRHREMVLEESAEAFRIVRAQHKAYREMDLATTQVMLAYRNTFEEYGFRDWLADHDGDYALEEIDLLEKALEKATCQCCIFGNHTERCTCDGEGCCHPEGYMRYDPEWGHGNG